jgi:hypothetical protein
VAAGRQSLGREVRLAAELHDSCSNLVGMALLFDRVLQKLLRNTLRMNAGSSTAPTAWARSPW